MKVFSPEPNYRLKKILMAAKIYGRDIIVENVDYEPKVSKGFKENNPQYSLPLLQTQQSKFISGTNTILIYLAGESNMQDRFVKTRMIEELQLIQKQIQAATGVLILHLKGYSQITQAQLQKSKEIFAKYLKNQNEKLALKSFLAGDKLTPADISSYHNILVVKEYNHNNLVFSVNSCRHSKILVDGSIIWKALMFSDYHTCILFYFEYLLYQMTQLVTDFTQKGLNKCLSKWTLPIGMGQQKQIAQGNSANLQKIDNQKRVAKILPASNQKYFDKDLKSYIYSLEAQNSKICLPGVQGQQLALNQRYLILNVFILLGQPWTLEIGLTDINGIKRRVNMTTVQGKNQTKYFSMRYHLQNIERGVWLFLGINVHSFIEPFKGQVFRSLDSITVGNGCLIRRVFTMKQFVEWQIPKNFWLSPQIPQQLQLISYQQRTLPNIHKSIHNDPPLSPPTKSIKHSKSSMVRSQVTNRILAKSKLSEDRGIFGEGHIKINVKNTIIGEQRIKKMVSSSPLSEKKSIKDKERNKYGKYERKIEKIEKEIQRISGSQSKQTQKQGYILKIPSKRSPILQKSFQEDQAFKNEFQDSSSHVETRNIKNLKRPIKTQKQERWEQDQELQQFPTPSKQTPSKQKQSKPITNLSKLSTIPQTILTKQNQRKVEGQEQKVQLQLIYDEMVGCYYHPQTNTFYQLKS